jgi:hypothetical protein
MKTHTLPACVSDDGYPRLDKIAKCEEGRLEGAFHGTDEDEAHVEVFGYPGHELFFELGALLASECRELRVVDAVVLWDVLVNTEEHIYMYHLDRAR